MGRVSLVVLGTLILGASWPTAAPAETLDLDGAVSLALGRNVTYQSALLAVGQAEAARTGAIHWKDVTVSATQSNESSSLGLSLPLFDQLGTSVAVDQEKTATVGLTATPLSHGTASGQLEIAYQKALLAADQARTTLVTSTKKAWLAQAVAQAQVEAQTRETGLMETAYLDAKVQYEKAAVTLSEVRTALKNWADARTTLSTLRQTLVKAKATLAALVQVESVDLAPMTIAAVQAQVEGLGPVDPQVTGNSTSVKVQGLEVAYQQAKADAIWWVDPQLSVSGSAVIPRAGAASWTGAVTLSLALGGLEVGDRLLADRAVALAQAALTAERTSVRSAEAQALLAVQAAAETVESRTVALNQAQDLLRETQLQAAAGMATGLDLEEAQLGVTTAENDLFSAWCDAWGARLDLAAARG